MLRSRRVGHSTCAEHEDGQAECGIGGIRSLARPVLPPSARRGSTRARGSPARRCTSGPRALAALLSAYHAAVPIDATDLRAALDTAARKLRVYCQYLQRDLERVRLAPHGQLAQALRATPARRNPGSRPATAAGSRQRRRRPRVFVTASCCSPSSMHTGATLHRSRKSSFGPGLSAARRVRG